MAEILITPGTFAPVLPAVEAGIALAFPRTPVLTVRKPGQNFQWVSQAQQESALGNVRRTEYNYYNGEARVTTTADGPAFPVLAVQPRYVPQGSYATGSRVDLVDATGYFFTAAATGTASGAVALGTVALNPYKDVGRMTSGAEYSLRVRVRISLAMLGVGDTAAYTLIATRNGSPTAIAGPDIEFDMPLYYTDTDVSFSEAITFNQTFLYGLNRNGVLLDQVSLTLQFTATVTAAAGYGTAVAGGGPDYAADRTVNDTLYGPTMTVATPAPPTHPHTIYIRTYRGNQGTLTSA